MTWRLGAGLLAVAAAATLTAPWRPAPGNGIAPVVGALAPAFTLPQLQDAARTVSPEQMAGQVWVLNVWASWCAPCREEHPLLLAVARDSGVPLVGLNTRDDPRDAQEWLRRVGDPYLTTAVDRDGRTGVDYGVNGVPQSFVIDRHGVVRHRHVGPLTPRAWAQDLLPLIATLRADVPAGSRLRPRPVPPQRVSPRVRGPAAGRRASRARWPPAAQRRAAS